MADIIFDPTGSLENFRTHFQTLSIEDGTIIILACDNNDFQKESIDPILFQSDIAAVYSKDTLLNGRDYLAFYNKTSVVGHMGYGY